MAPYKNPSNTMHAPAYRLSSKLPRSFSPSSHTKRFQQTHGTCYFYKFLRINIIKI